MVRRRARKGNQPSLPSAPVPRLIVAAALPRSCQARDFRAAAGYTVRDNQTAPSSPGGRLSSRPSKSRPSTSRVTLFFPNCFAEEEIAVLRSEAESISGATARRSGARSPARRAPPSPPTPTTRRSAFSARHPRLVEPLEQLFGEKLYMHQFKINAEGAVRRRGVAVAPGLRHLGARRRHARAARHEHLGVPRRGDADQRPADVHPEEPQATARWRPATTRPPPAIRCGRWTRRR